jgi:hypothetical protein
MARAVTRSRTLRLQKHSHPQTPQHRFSGMKAKSFILAAPIVACLLCSAMGADKPITADPAAAGNGVQVGVAKRDGVTVSGDEAFVTRNGATEKLTKELALPSGVIVKPNGMMILPDRTEAPLRASQILTFDGKVSEIPPDPAVNPAPVGPSATFGTNTISGAVQPSAQVTGGSGSFSSPRNQNNGGGSVFVGSDGVPFMGSIGMDGFITRADGVRVANDGTIRAVRFGKNGNPALAKINADGSITQADGSTVFPNGTVRSANGTITPAPQNDLGTANNGNSNPGVPQAGTNQPVLNNGVAATANPSPNTNSPNNTGTVNVGNAGAGGNSANNTGTVNNPNSSTTGSTSGTTGQTNGTSTTGSANSRGTTGSTRSNAAPAHSTNGGASGTGATGAGGASGGGAGGATR